MAKYQRLEWCYKCATILNEDVQDMMTLAGYTC